MNHGPFYRSAELVAGVHRAGAGNARGVGGGAGGVSVRGGCGNRGGSRDRGKGERLQRSAQRRCLVWQRIGEPTDVRERTLLNPSDTRVYSA